MTFNLTIDQGNTSTKLALWDAQGRLVRTTTRVRFVARDVAGIAPGCDIDTAIYCTVSRRPPAMLRALERRARKVIEFSVETPMPLSVDSRTPHTLGLDRLAAAVGAFGLEGCRNRELLVVDMGTAITYDRVTADARYAGGNIAPGLFMRLKALNHYTARLPLIDPRVEPSGIPVWGNDTRSALIAGSVRGVVAELEYYRNSISPNAAVVLTGGDAEMISDLVSFKPIVEPNLVSLGLENIIRYNNLLDSGDCPTTDCMSPGQSSPDYTK